MQMQVSAWRDISGPKGARTFPEPSALSSLMSRTRKPSSLDEDQFVRTTQAVSYYSPNVAGHPYNASHCSLNIVCKARVLATEICPLFPLSLAEEADTLVTLQTIVMHGRASATSITTASTYRRTCRRVPTNCK